MVGRRAAGWSGRERTREHFRRIGLPGDEACIRLVTTSGEVTAYTVQYEAWIEGSHRPVVRYDSAHGQPHLDILGWDGNVDEKIWLAPEPLAAALNTAVAHLDAHWARLREEFVNRRPR